MATILLKRGSTGPLQTRPSSGVHRGSSDDVRGPQWVVICPMRYGVYWCICPRRQAAHAVLSSHALAIDLHVDSLHCSPAHFSSRRSKKAFVPPSASYPIEAFGSKFRLTMQRKRRALPTYYVVHFFVTPNKKTAKKKKEH